MYFKFNVIDLFSSTTPTTHPVVLCFIIDHPVWCDSKFIFITFTQILKGSIKTIM